MGEIKQIIIKNRTYYFYNDRIDLNDFDAKLLKIEKKVSKNMKKFGKVLKEKLKQLMVVKKLNMAKILEKFRLERIGLNLTMICH